MANLIRFDPFAELQALQKQLFNDSWFTVPAISRSLPTTDVYTENDKLVVEAHLPYFEEKDITLDIDNGMLEIQAEKHEKVEDKDKKYVVRESSSSFYRSLRLPDQADADKVEARLDNGILRVSIPFKNLPVPKKITITSGEQAPDEEE